MKTLGLKRPKPIASPPFLRSSIFPCLPKTYFFLSFLILFSLFPQLKKNCKISRFILDICSFWSYNEHMFKRKSQKILFGRSRPTFLSVLRLPFWSTFQQFVSTNLLKRTLKLASSFKLKEPSQ